MCGVLGSFGPSSSKYEKFIDFGLDSLKHRGPDAQAKEVFASENFFFGHTRLSILDLSEDANQPMAGSNGLLVYNGEIYNHLELRQTYLSQESFATTSDTETLLIGIEKKENAFFDHLQGMFAGAYFNKSTRELTLFRDSLGIKPLYYHVRPDNTVLFASEIKTLLAICPDIERSINFNTFASYMTYENFPQPSSFFKNISVVQPGQILCFDSRGTSKSKISPFKVETATNVSEVERSIVDSVKSHLLSDVPLGVYMSGGYDSSLVATLASLQNSKIHDHSEILAFTGYFDTKDEFYDERPYAREVANKAGLTLNEVRIEPLDFKNVFDQIIWSLDEPRMGMGCFSQFIVAREAAKHRKVILAGHGGDELFAGYPLFKALWFFELGFTQKLLKMKNLKVKEWPWVIYAYMQMQKKNRFSFAPQLFDQPPEKIRGEYDFEEHFNVKATENLKDSIKSYYHNVYLPGLLVVEDRISMAHSLETRVPLWSQKILAQISQIPLEELMENGELKGLLKKVAKNFLPESLFSAPKRGFPTPLRLWFRNELKDFISERLVESEPLHSFVAKKEIEDLLNSHQNRPLPFALDERRAHRIWILLCIESWLRQFKLSLN